MGGFKRYFLGILADISFAVVELTQHFLSESSFRLKEIRQYLEMSSDVTFLKFKLQRTPSFIDKKSDRKKGRKFHKS